MARHGEREVLIIKELKSLERQDGSYSPEDVVTFARSHKKSAIHDCFNWNLNEAAHEHWLLTARHLLKRYIVITESRSKEVTIGRLISVPSRRKSDEASMVSPSAIRANEAWRQEVLHEQSSKLRTMRNEFSSLLPELKPVWKAIRRVLDE